MVLHIIQKFRKRNLKTEKMLIKIIRTETKEILFYEAVFNWGSLYAFTIKELLNELLRFDLKYSLN